MSCLSVQAEGDALPPVEEFLSGQVRDSALVDSMRGIVDDLSYTNLSLAFEYGETALEIADSIGYDRGRAWMNYLISRIYNSMGLVEPAFEKMRKAIELNEQLRDTTRLAWCYNNLALLNQDNSLPSLAEKYFLKAHALFKAVEHPKFIPYPLINLGALYNDLDRDDEALQVYQEVLREYPDSGNLFRNAVIYNNIGNLLWEVGKNDSALVVLHQALDMKLSYGKSYNTSSTLMNIGKVHINLGHYDSAAIYLDSARFEASRVAKSEYLLDIMEVEASLEAAKHNFEDAYSLLRNLVEIRDSVIISQHEDKLQELMSYYELDQKNSEIALLQKDNELFRSRQRFQIFAIGGLLLLLLLLSGFYWNNRRLSSKVKAAYSDLRTTHRQISSQQKEILNQKSSLEQKNQHLEDLVREKEGLIGIVAHDLKSPFNKTLAVLELMKRDGELSEQGARFAEMIRSTSAEAMELIESLLILSTMEEEEGAPLEKELTPLNDLVVDRVESFEASAKKKGIKILSDLEEGSPKVLSVPRDLERILDNLISNAIKFSGKGEEILVGVGRHGEMPSLYVKDSGPGLTEDDQKKLFKRFQKLSARPTAGESSHGLGLAIVKSLADRLSGEVRLDSEPGKGAKFEFVFAERDIS